MDKIQVINETKYDDGSYSALVRHYGCEFAIHFVAGEVRVYGTSKRNPLGWKLTASRKAAKQWAAARIASFGPEFMAAHNALYAEEAE